MPLELSDLSPRATLLPVCLLAANSPAASARKIWPTTKSPPSKVSRRSGYASRKKVLSSFAARSRMGLSGSNTRSACILPNSAGLQRRRVCFLRHRIVTKLARQRLAPQQPLQPHPRPPHHAKMLNRLIRIHRTSRFEPAAPPKRDRQVHLINTQRRQRHFHANRLFPTGCRGGACPTLLRGRVDRPRWDRLHSVLFSRFVSAAHIHRWIYTLIINRTKSPANPANSARATLLFG